MTDIDQFIGASIDKYLKDTLDCGGLWCAIAVEYLDSCIEVHGQAFDEHPTTGELCEFIGERAVQSVDVYDLRRLH